MLNELVPILGWSLLKELANKLGGQRIYIPKDPARTPAALIAVLGEPRTKKVYTLYKGTPLDIPRRASVEAAYRTETVRPIAIEMLGRGYPLRTISTRTGYSPRTLRRLQSQL